MCHRLIMQLYFRASNNKVLMFSVRKINGKFWLSFFPLLTEVVPTLSSIPSLTFCCVSLDSVWGEIRKRE